MAYHTGVEYQQIAGKVEGLASDLLDNRWVSQLWNNQNLKQDFSRKCLALELSMIPSLG